MLSGELQVDDDLTKASDEWVTRVSTLVYDVYGAASTADAAATALGIRSYGRQSRSNVDITGGTGEFRVLRVNRDPTEPTDVVPLAYAQSALSSSALPFTAPGDLLVYRSPGTAHVLAKGPVGTVLDAQTLTWVPPASGAGVPTSFIVDPLVVAVGPVEHPDPHDQWFPTVDAFNFWAGGKIVLSSLTVLPNGFPATDDVFSVLVLPTTVEGATVVIGTPVAYSVDADGIPVAQLGLRARDTTIVASSLAIFDQFFLEDCALEVQDMWLRFYAGGSPDTVLGRGVTARIENLWLRTPTFVGGEGFSPPANRRVEHAELDIGVLHVQANSTGPAYALSLVNSTCFVRQLLQSGVANNTGIECVNSTLVVEDTWLIPGGLYVGAWDSHVEFASGIQQADTVNAFYPILRANSSTLLIAFYDDDGARALSVTGDSDVKLGGRAVIDPVEELSPVENNVYGLSETSFFPVFSPSLSMVVNDFSLVEVRTGVANTGNPNAVFTSIDNPDGAPPLPQV